jgi:hypothetical protein
MAREFINTSLYNDANLVAYYKLEDTADSKGSNTLTNSGSVSFSTGKFGNGALFSGSNALYTASVFGIGTTNFSMSAWVYIPSTSLSGAFVKVGKDATGGGANTGYGMGVGGTQYDNSGNNFILLYEGVRWIGTGTALGTGWHHVVMTVDGSSVPRAYIDGVFINSYSGTGPVAPTTYSSIGAVVGNSTSNINYKISNGVIVDDVAILSRALTASEVKSIYTSKTFQVDTNKSLNVGLESYYKLEDTYDYYGSNNLTNNGGATFGAGKVNNGVDFGSSNTTKYLSIASPTGLPTGAGARSIAFWFKTPASLVYARDVAVGYGTASTGQGFEISYIGTTAPDLFVDIYNGGGGVSYTWSADTWYHVVVTYSGSGTNAIGYVNGTSLGNIALGGTPNTGVGSGMQIGRRATTGDSYLDGKVDEVGIWSKALSTTEISDLYNGGAGQTMAQTLNKRFQVDNAYTLNDNLVSYYKLGDTYDFYGSNNLTNEGGVTFAAGKVNNCADFGSSNSTKYLVMSDETALRGTSGSISGSFWIKTSSTTAAMLITKGNSYGDGATNHWGVQFTATGKINVIVTDNNVGWGDVVDSTASVNDGNWHHVAFQLGSSGQFVWIDGSLDVNEPTHTRVSGYGGNVKKPVSIGALYRVQLGVWQSHFSGLIDDVALFTKTLSSQEVEDLYNGGNGQTMNPPIEFDAFTANAQEPGTSATFSHTCGTGNNRLLLVGVWINEASASIMSSVTYGGVTMTSLKRSVITSTWSQYFYYLLAPATGANNVVVTWNGSSKYVYTRVCSYVGVAQTGFPDVDATASGTGTSIVATGTTTKDNVWIAGMWGNASYTNGTPTAPIVARSAAEFQYFDSNSPITPAGSKSVTYTVTGSQNSDLYWVAFAPYEATTTNTSNFFLFFD